jgi:hypothetical protein
LENGISARLITTDTAEELNHREKYLVPCRCRDLKLNWHLHVPHENATSVRRARQNERNNVYSPRTESEEELEEEDEQDSTNSGTDEWWWSQRKGSKKTYLYSSAYHICC